jgi:hypothetical protein
MKEEIEAATRTNLKLALEAALIQHETLFGMLSVNYGDTLLEKLKADFEHQLYCLLTGESILD